MKTFLNFLALLIAATLLPLAAYAKPPYVEIYYIDYPAEDCGERADAALAAAGFRLKQGTWQKYDHVGSKGDYKGVVSCVPEKQITAITVAGPIYKDVNTHAIAIRESFKAWSKEQPAAK